MSSPGLQACPAAHELGALECSVDPPDRLVAVVLLKELRAGLASKGRVELVVELVCRGVAAAVDGSAQDVISQPLQKGETW